jgi:hypothetical protein
VVFYVLFYLYLWLWVDPSLLRHGQGSLSFPEFSLRSSFIRGFLGNPGGPTECLVAFLSQAYHCAWGGALVLAAVAALMGGTLRGFLSAMTGVRVPLAWCVPALLLLVLSNHYVHGLAMPTGVLLATSAAWAYTGLSRWRITARLAAFLVLGVPVYYVAGGCFLLYALLWCARPSLAILAN